MICKENDNWMTPKNAWSDIKHLIPNQVIWEPFYGDGKSGQYLTELGFNVIHENTDFFENDLGEFVVSNPPFSILPKILSRLKEINKPFILIMPSSKINTQYFRALFLDESIQLIIPKKRIQFLKLINGTIIENKSGCNFDCFYYCWKMNFEKDIIWLK